MIKTEAQAWSRTLRAGLLEAIRAFKEMQKMPKTKEAVKYWFINNVLNYSIFAFLIVALFLAFIGR